jgi:ribosome-associated toxin RatA of RatAB toxin-antitoxin module
VLYRAQREVEVRTTPEEFFDLVWQFERYPEFVTGIAATKVLSRDPKDAHVEFTARLMGVPFRYELAVERLDSQVVWQRVAGAFERAEGAWTLVERSGDRCRFRYENAVDPGIPAPGFIVKYVLNTSLPKLLEEFRIRAESRDGGKPGSV